LAPSLAALMKSPWDPVEKRLRCLRAISEHEIDNAQRFLLAKIVDLYIELDEAEAERFAVEASKDKNEEVLDMVITWEETLAAATATGEEIGEARGEARGGLLALRNSVLRILKKRLESVPAFVRTRLDAIQSIERLEEILDQALTVSSVDELGLDA
jgi:hypothetical protein